MRGLLVAQRMPEADPFGLGKRAVPLSRGESAVTYPSPDPERALQQLRHVFAGYVGPSVESALADERPELHVLGLEDIDATMRRVRQNGAQRAVVNVLQAEETTKPGVSTIRKTSDQEQQLAAARRAVGLGLHHQHLALGSTIPFLFAYLPDVPDNSWVRNVAGNSAYELVTLQGRDRAALYAPGAAPASPLVAAAAQQLRTRGWAEQPLDVLEARVQAVDGAVAAAIASLLCEDILAALAIPGGHHAATRGLYRQFRAELLADDIAEKTACMVDLRDHLTDVYVQLDPTQATGRSGAPPDKVAVLPLLAARQERAANDVYEWLDMRSEVLVQRRQQESIRVATAAKETAVRRAVARAEVEARNAQQLDVVILPEHPPGQRFDAEDIKTAVGPQEVQRTERHATTKHPLMWERVADLAEIAGFFGGEFKKSKPETLGGQAPWYLAIIEMQDVTCAIATSPVYGHATYIVTERDAPGTWLDILMLRRTEARDLGARSIWHLGLHPDGDQRVRLLLSKLDELFDTTRLTFSLKTGEKIG